jgi:hypothetical protein
VANPAPYRRHRHPAFSNAHVTVGAIHMAGMIAGILATDKMKEPGARWSAIAGFGVATGIGEAIWRDRIERERERDERNQEQD